MGCGGGWTARSFPESSFALTLDVPPSAPESWDHATPTLGGKWGSPKGACTTEMLLGVKLSVLGGPRATSSARRGSGTHGDGTKGAVF